MDPYNVGTLWVNGTVQPKVSFIIQASSVVLSGKSCQSCSRDDTRTSRHPWPMNDQSLQQSRGNKTEFTPFRTTIVNVILWKDLFAGAMSQTKNLCHKSLIQFL